MNRINAECACGARFTVEQGDGGASWAANLYSAWQVIHRDHVSTEEEEDCNCDLNREAVAANDVGRTLTWHCPTHGPHESENLVESAEDAATRYARRYEQAEAELAECRERLAQAEAALTAYDDDRNRQIEERDRLRSLLGDKD